MDKFKAITVQRIGQIAYVYFNFNNGVMNTHQCFVLKQAIAQLKQTDVKVIVLMGGEKHWCNGINTRNIELAVRPEDEREQNLAAMSDLVQEVASINKQITVAAIGSHLGSGGLALALACDKMVIREDVVLNRAGEKVDLYDENVHSFLSKAIGKGQAYKMMVNNHPYMAAELLQMGMADKLLDCEWSAYHATLYTYCEQLLDSVGFETYLTEKLEQHRTVQLSTVLAKTRLNALIHMQKSHRDDEHCHLQSRLSYQPNALVSA